MIRTLLKSVLLIASLIALGFLARHFQIGDMLSERWIDSEVRGHGAQGKMVFLAMATLTTAIGFPRQVVSFLGGYAFGFLPGTALALLGTVLGCLTSFYYARGFGRSLITRRFSDRVQKLNDFLRQHPFNMTLVIRLLPVGSNVTTNLVAGVTRIPFLPFVAGSTMGYLPQTLIFALAGSGVNLDATLRLGIATLLFAISSALGMWLYRRYRQAAELQEESGIKSSL